MSKVSGKWTSAGGNGEAMKLEFPDSFRFGVADADLQVIGERLTLAKEGSEETEWRQYALTSGKCFENTTPDEGVDRHSRWKDDVDIMYTMGVRHYRTSISMSRVLKRDGSVNGNAIEWYRNYFTSLRQAGIEIYATLYHWELPEFLKQQGGWVNRNTVDWLVRHAHAVQEYLGDLISEYFVLNEPWCSSFLSHHWGIHAPGHTDLPEALRAAHHLLLAQGVIVNELLSKDPAAKVGTVYNVQSCYGATAKAKDLDAARHADEYFNGWFLEPLFLGRYPQNLVEFFGAAMPETGPADMRVIQAGGKLHSLGLNYYSGSIVEWDEASALKFRTVVREGGSFNDLGWPIFLPPRYPEGLTDILQQVYWRYRDHGLKRIYVTENGMALRSEWDGVSETVDDERRVEYLQGHLKQVYNAIVSGVPVEGYFLWTLMDNFEWCHGYKPESSFGIVHVDRKTMRRVRKQSSLWYENVMRSKSVEA